MVRSQFCLGNTWPLMRLLHHPFWRTYRGCNKGGLYSPLHTTTLHPSSATKRTLTCSSCTDQERRPRAAACTWSWSSLRFFKLQIGEPQERVSTLRLTTCVLPPDVQVAQLPRRGRPPNSARAPTSTPLPSTPGPSTTTSPPAQRAQCRSVSFRCPLVSTDLQPSLQQQLYPSGLPARSAGPSKRYHSALSTQDGQGLGGAVARR
jgi:hypothetical protein